MNATAHAIAAIALGELRLRLRRPSTLVTLLVIAALTTLAVSDFRTSGEALIVVDKVRYAYQSLTLAIGTGLLAGLLMSLVAFYLVRGRSQEELRCGTAHVLAATAISDAALLAGRWLGALLYLGGLALALMVTTIALQLLRGEGSIEPLVYLQTYGLILLPALMFAAAMAVLCDAWAPLMGRRGDLLYFVLWAAQFGVMPLAVEGEARGGAVLAIDLSGSAATLNRLRQLGLDNFSIPGGEFDPALPAATLPADFWSAETAALRIGSAALALVPLLIAVRRFHRFAPDKVKAGTGARHGALRVPGLAALQNLLRRPVGRLSAALLRLAAQLPRLGPVLAELATTLAMTPIAWPLMLLGWLIGAFCDDAALAGLLTAQTLLYGVLIGEIAARDHRHGAAALAAAVPGGAQGARLRQWLATLLLGLVLTAPVLLRWIEINPGGAIALACGVTALAAAASLLGRLAGTGRAFLALFLLGFYIATQATAERWFDIVGFNGSADALSSGVTLLFGAAAALLAVAAPTRR